MTRLCFLERAREHARLADGRSLSRRARTSQESIQFHTGVKGGKKSSTQLVHNRRGSYESRISDETVSSVRSIRVSMNNRIICSFRTIFHARRDRDDVSKRNHRYRPQFYTGWNIFTHFVRVQEACTVLKVILFMECDGLYFCIIHKITFK